MNGCRSSYAGVVPEYLMCGEGVVDELEAEVGIDRISPSTSHSKSIVYGIADFLTISGLRPLSTRIRAYLFQPVLAHSKRSVLALLLALYVFTMKRYSLQ